MKRKATLFTGITALLLLAAGAALAADAPPPTSK